ncbi:MAG: YHYH protein [Myxococcales bacterium]|nr:YHYH protein [Myxococcales bacterium]
MLGTSACDGRTTEATQADGTLVESGQGDGGSIEARDSGNVESGDAGPVEETQGGTCTAAWKDLLAQYNDVGTIGTCDTAEGKRIAETLMRFVSLKINNNGKEMVPCVQIQCDETHAYIVSNALPHYDFVQTTPNVLKESLQIYRIPLQPKEPASGQGDAISDIKGCQTAYQQYLTSPNQGTQTEPSQLCTQGAGVGYLKETVQGKEVTYQRLVCLGTVGFAISGVPLYGPNEATIPDPWGNPFFFTPDTAADFSAGGDLTKSAALDLCFGHTAASMHYHGLNEACFLRKTDGTPRHSYADATASWNFRASLEGSCTEESPVIGWGLDGVPIKGPCVCLERGSDGSCSKLKRARSAWVYRGLGAWGEDSREQAALGVEGKSCTALSDCCTDPQKCDFKCSYVVTEDASSPEGSVVGKRCVLLDYSWCTHHYVDRSGVDTQQANFVYMDRCNGYKGPNGYAYHVTTSFPFMVGCHRYQAEPQRGQQQGGGPNGGIPTCNATLKERCCGDGICGGPENAQNCSVDCK